MSHFDVTLAAEPAAYRPGEFLEGEGRWRLDEQESSLTLKVYWTTDGANSASAGQVVVHEQTLPVSSPEGRQSFRVELPQGPWSFQGKLFSVRWYVELGRDDYSCGRAEFVLGPEARAIVAPGGAGTPP